MLNMAITTAHSLTIKVPDLSFTKLVTANVFFHIPVTSNLHYFETGKFNCHGKIITFFF